MDVPNFVVFHATFTDDADWFENEDDAREYVQQKATEADLGVYVLAEVNEEGGVGDVIALFYGGEEYV